VRSIEQRYWTHRFRVASRQTELSLGPYPKMTLDQALKKYPDRRSQVTNRVDPIADKHAQGRKDGGAASARALTFAQEAERFIERKEIEKGGKWTSDVHRRQWRATLLKGTVAEILGPMPIAKIDTAAVLKVLEPMWTKTPEAASRVRGRIQTVLDAGHVRLDIERANPARWKGKLEKIFSPRRNLAHETLSDSDAVGLAPISASLSIGSPATPLQTAFVGVAVGRTPRLGYRLGTPASHPIPGLQGPPCRPGVRQSGSFSRSNECQEPTSGGQSNPRVRPVARGMPAFRITRIL
jgi:hypothetical protein